MRHFSSYGPIDPELYYHAPRKELIARGVNSLIGKEPGKGGHYITVWAPRQCGKTWVMQEVVQQIRKREDYHVGMFTIEAAKVAKNVEELLSIFLNKMAQAFEIDFPPVKDLSEIPSLFTKKYFQKPVILIIDEFDSLEENIINEFASIFRDIYVGRLNERDKESGKKNNLLHGLALIGVRSVLGIENKKGSPFNTQKSLHIPNLSFDEVNGMFQWYTGESGQEIEPEVIETLYNETLGQPGLTCWLGELLTETYNKETNKPVSMDLWNYTYMYASQGLPNNNILNIISKSEKEPYRTRVLELFRTAEKENFRFDDKQLNYLYMNGVIDIDESKEDLKLYVRFASPFVQKRLFDYFSNEIFPRMGQLIEPFENLDGLATETSLNVKNIAGTYEVYLSKNHEWLFQDAPRRKDLRLFEAVYHFNFYRYVYDLIKVWKSPVYAEFPTGNGKIDLFIRHRGQTYGMELKSFTTEWAYKEALKQSAAYVQTLGLQEIHLILFIENIDDKNRGKYEAEFVAADAGGVVVKPVFVQVGG